MMGKIELQINIDKYSSTKSKELATSSTAQQMVVVQFMQLTYNTSLSFNGTSYFINSSAEGGGAIYASYNTSLSFNGTIATSLTAQQKT